MEGGAAGEQLAGADTAGEGLGEKAEALVPFQTPPARAGPESGPNGGRARRVSRLSRSPV